MFKLHANTVIFCQLRMLKLMYLKYCHFDKGSCTLKLRVSVDIITTIYIVHIMLVKC